MFQRAFKKLPCYEQIFSKYFFALTARALSRICLTSLARREPEFKELLTGYKQEGVNVSQCDHKPAFKCITESQVLLLSNYI